MSIKLNDGTVLRNLEEQVQYLTNYHDVNQGLVQWGIRVVGQVETADELPLPYNGEYGDAIAVGTEAPFFFYIWTRASIEGNPAYWFPFGEISIIGPEGPKGDRGEKGDTGESTKWYVGSSVPNASSQSYVNGDMYLQTNGQVYIYQNGSWQSSTNIRGPQGIQGIQGMQGIQGIQGIQGPKGDTGDVGGFINIAGIVANTSQLPTPSSLDNLTIAYLIGTAEPYNLWIQIGNTSDTAVWTDMGPLNVATYVTVNGQFQNVWDADTKVSKTNNTNRLYGTDANGNQTSYQISTTPGSGGNTIPKRYTNGSILVPLTPSANNEAASKKYVDDAVAGAGGGTKYLHQFFITGTNCDLNYKIVDTNPNPYTGADFDLLAQKIEAENIIGFYGGPEGTGVIHYYQGIFYVNTFSENTSLNFMLEQIKAWAQSAQELADNVTIYEEV